MIMKKIFTIALSLMLWTSFSSSAEDLRVRVFERGSNVPLSGAAVCLGTDARLDQFGAIRTDKKGYVLFSDLPHARVVVTASMPGFKSEQEVLVTSNTDRMLVLSLSSGGGGVRCPISSAGTGLSSAGLAVSRFAINEGAAETAGRTVKLHNKLTGMATQYRASESQDLEGVDWQYYDTAPEFSLSAGAGVKRVYLQVRRHSTVNGATLETLSPVVQDSIRLR